MSSIIPNLRYHTEVKEKLRHNEILTTQDRTYLCKLLDVGKHRKNELPERVYVPEKSSPRVDFGSQVLEEEIISATAPKRVAEVQPTPKNDIAIDDSPVVDYLKEQLKLPKQKREIARIKKNLDRTFETRRQLVTMSDISVSMIKERYPILFEREQIIEEFKRVTHANVESSFNENLSKYKDAIFESSRTSGCVYGFIERQRKCHLEENASHETMTNFKLVGALLLLPALLNEDFCHIVHFSTSAPVTSLPIIISSFSEKEAIQMKTDIIYKIYADDTLICTAPDLPTAFFLYMAVFYVFDMHYPVNCTKTTALVEHLLLHLEIDEHHKEIEKLTKALQKLLRGKKS